MSTRLCTLMSSMSSHSSSSPSPSGVLIGRLKRRRRYLSGNKKRAGSGIGCGLWGDVTLSWGTQARTLSSLTLLTRPLWLASGRWGEAGGGGDKSHNDPSSSLSPPSSSSSSSSSSSFRLASSSPDVSALCRCWNSFNRAECNSWQRLMVTTFWCCSSRFSSVIWWLLRFSSSRKLRSSSLRLFPRADALARPARSSPRAATITHCWSSKRSTAASHRVASSASSSSNKQSLHLWMVKKHRKCGN